jgi:serine phosphatase RsbU (regulator of sigma subunit)
VLCGVMDSAFSELRLSNAGHLPPVFLEGVIGTASVLSVPPDLPLGVGTATRATTTVAVPSHGAVCLYTDGLVERRGQSIDVGIERLRAAVKPGQTAEQICATVMGTMVGAQVARDDIALLVLRHTGPLTPSSSSRGPSGP